MRKIGIATRQAARQQQKKSFRKQKFGIFFFSTEARFPVYNSSGGNCCQCSVSHCTKQTQAQKLFGVLLPKASALKKKKKKNKPCPGHCCLPQQLLQNGYFRHVISKGDALPKLLQLYQNPSPLWANSHKQSNVVSR